MLGFPWAAIRAILSSTAGSLLPPLPERKRVHPYMMLPLDAASVEPQISLEKLETLLYGLSDIGVEGVMVDVWWGECERLPCQYDFSSYIKLFQMLKEARLKVQAIMSFHSCGGNIGDSVNIPLPDWVVNAAEGVDGWFQDQEGNQNHEYLSFGVDHVSFLPSLDAKRTPVRAYADFVAAFLDAVRENELEDSMSLHIGLGPCGELRYPSYTLDKWKFPGIGAFQCYDKHLFQSLKNALSHADESVKGAPLPPYAGSYNDKPWQASFFRRDWKTPSGKFFLDWYSSELLRHGTDVLTAVKHATDKPLSIKIAGIHWWYHHGTRAAESTTGYINGSGSIYADIAKLCKEFNAELNFTCLEMRSIDQPLWARCGPRQLVREVFDAGFAAGIKVAGENALERWDRKAFRQILRVFRRARGTEFSYTHLRLSDKISNDGWKNFEWFVQQGKTLN